MAEQNPSPEKTDGKPVSSKSKGFETPPQTPSTAATGPLPTPERPAVLTLSRAEFIRRGKIQRPYDSILEKRDELAGQELTLEEWQKILTDLKNTPIGGPA